MIRILVTVSLLSVALLGVSSTAVAGDLMDPFARPRAKRPAPRAAPRSEVLDPWQARPTSKPRTKTGKPKRATPPRRRPSAGELLDPWARR